MCWGKLGNLGVIDRLPPPAGAGIADKCCAKTSVKKSTAVAEKFKMIEMIAARMVVINFCKAHNVS
jgi:hypothetical protein